VLGELPSWLDVDFARSASAALAVAAIVLVLVAIFVVRSVGTRIVVVALLGAAVFGLLRYRDTLDHCDKAGCPCRLLGEELNGGGCTPTP
jgi:hypothetical protein